MHGEEPSDTERSDSDLWEERPSDMRVQISDLLNRIYLYRSTHNVLYNKNTAVSPSGDQIAVATFNLLLLLQPNRLFGRPFLDGLKKFAVKQSSSTLQPSLRIVITQPRSFQLRQFQFVTLG